MGDNDEIEQVIKKVLDDDDDNNDEVEFKIQKPELKKQLHEKSSRINVFQNEIEEKLKRDKHEPVIIIENTNNNTIIQKSHDTNHSTNSTISNNTTNNNNNNNNNTTNKTKKINVKKEKSIN